MLYDSTHGTPGEGDSRDKADPDPQSAGRGRRREIGDDGAGSCGDETTDFVFKTGGFYGHVNYLVKRVNPSFNFYL